MIAITGGTGHSGSFLVDILHKNNFQDKIRFLIRDNSNTTRIDEYGLDCEKCNISLTDVDALSKAFYGVDTVLPIAGIQFSPYIVDAAVKKVVSLYPRNHK